MWYDMPDTPVELDLSYASVGPIFDDRDSWPENGSLSLNGLVYSRFGVSSTDATSRLKWLNLQNYKVPSWPLWTKYRIRRAMRRILHREYDSSEPPWPVFRPQPFQQLAKVLREDGDNVGARRVLVAMENQRRKYGKLSFLTWLWRSILRVTIGYGYRPWYALLWGLAIVTVASLLFARGYSLNAVAPTDKEAYQIFETHNPKQSNHGDLPAYYVEFSPVVYSLDNFLPIINLGEKDHWMPNPHEGGFGEVLRIYLWVHISLGWLLTTLFVAGLTPIVRSG